MSRGKTIQTETSKTAAPQCAAVQYEKDGIPPRPTSHSPEYEEDTCTDVGG